MQNQNDPDIRSRHLRITEPSPWVRRFAPLAPEGGLVLDLGAGNGRHGRYFLDRGHPIVAVDRDVSALVDLAGSPGAEIIEADLETGGPVFDGDGPLAGRTFAAIVAVNYLYRPLMDGLIGALESGGVLIYETFARGNEQFQKPRNPDQLLEQGELLRLCQGRLQVVAYEHGLVEVAEIPGVKQRISAVNDLGASDRDDGQPPPHPIVSS